RSRSCHSSKWESARSNEDVDPGDRRGNENRCARESKDSKIHCRQDCPQCRCRPEETCQRGDMSWKNFWKEFKEFAIKGNAVDLAVGVIIGAAFGSIVNSLVKDVVMPPISLLTGGLDFSNKFMILPAAKDGSTAFNTPADAAKAGATTWNYGNFITMVINFLVVSGSVFLRRRAIDHMCP